MKSTLVSSLIFLSYFFVSTAHGIVRMDVFPGYDGVATEGSWFPFAVEVENDGPSFNGTFELGPGQYGQGQTRVMPIELPTGTTKRFIIPVYAASRYRSTWDARIVDEKGKVRAESLGVQTRRQLQAQMPLVGAITRTASGLPVLPEVKNKQNEWQPAVTRLQPVLFPDSPIALEGLDALYLNSEKALDLKVNQVNALMAWLHGGGHLIVGVEQIIHVNGNEWLRRLLPCELTGLGTTTSHAELQEFVQGTRRNNGLNYTFSDSSQEEPRERTRRQPGGQRSVVAPFPNPYAKLGPDSQFESVALQVASCNIGDGTTLVGQAAPLIVTARRGRGQISVLLFSPEMEPFLSWKNRAYFWAKMIDLPPETLATEQYPRYSAFSIDGVFGAMIDSKQVRKLPVWTLLLLLVGYLAVIGPIDQYWLKKINRQMLTWITFPIYVACFSALIYLIGYKLRAGETEWNELHVVDVLSSGPQSELRGITFGSIYSPVNARYRFTGDHPFATLRGEYLRDYYRGGQEVSRVTIEQRGNSFAAEASVPVWTSQLYISDWWRRGDKPLSFGVSGSGSSRQLLVTNHLETALNPVRLVLDGRVYEVGRVGPQETKTFEPSSLKSDSLENFVLRHGGTFSTAVQQRQQAFGGNIHIAALPEGAMAACFASAFLKEGSNNQYGYSGGFISPPGLDLSEQSELGDAILLAWSPGFSLAKPMGMFSPKRNHRDTLFRLTAPML